MQRTIEIRCEGEPVPLSVTEVALALPSVGFSDVNNLLGILERAGAIRKAAVEHFPSDPKAHPRKLWRWFFPARIVFALRDGPAEREEGVA